METTILLSARRYDFNDDKGASVKGVTLQYLTGDTENTDTGRGCSVFTITAPFDVWLALKTVPGVYDLDFKQRPGKGGRPTLQCVSANFKAPFDALTKKSG